MNIFDDDFAFKKEFNALNFSINSRNVFSRDNRRLETTRVDGLMIENYVRNEIIVNVLRNIFQSRNVERMCFKSHN